MPNLSVIVPVYKVEKYLPKCIESILAQTYSDLELILVDDGSPDNCGAICDDYANKDSRVVVIHKENAGVSAARNDGLNRAKGKYIGFIDSDDFVSSNMYEELITNLEIHNCELAIAGYDYVDEDGNINRSYAVKENETLSQKELMYKQCDINPTIRFGVVNKLYKTDIAKELYFPTDLKSAEDGVFLFGYLEKINKAVFVHQPLYKNCERQGSATHGGLKPVELQKALAIHKKMAEDIKKTHPDVYHHAFSFYIDICLRYYNSCKDDKEVFGEINRILKKEKLNVLKCKEFNLKFKFSFLLKY